MFNQGISEAAKGANIWYLVQELFFVIFVGFHSSRCFVITTKTCFILNSFLPRSTKRHRQVRQLRYNVTLWRIRVTIFRWKHNNGFSVWCWWVTFHCPLCKNIACCRTVFCGEFRSPAQCKSHVSVFERNCFSSYFALLSHVISTRCTETQDCSFARGLF
jgi:hypothetical protein